MRKSLEKKLFAEIVDELCEYIESRRVIHEQVADEFAEEIREMNQKEDIDEWHKESMHNNYERETTIVKAWNYIENAVLKLEVK